MWMKWKRMEMNKTTNEDGESDESEEKSEYS